MFFLGQFYNVFYQPCTFTISIENSSGSLEAHYHVVLIFNHTILNSCNIGTIELIQGIGIGLSDRIADITVVVSVVPVRCEEHVVVDLDRRHGTYILTEGHQVVLATPTNESVVFESEVNIHTTGFVRHVRELHERMHITQIVEQVFAERHFSHAHIHTEHRHGVCFQITGMESTTFHSEVVDIAGIFQTIQLGLYFDTENTTAVIFENTVGKLQ